MFNFFFKNYLTPENYLFLAQYLQFHCYITLKIKGLLSVTTNASSIQRWRYVKLWKCCCWPAIIVLRYFVLKMAVNVFCKKAKFVNYQLIKFAIWVLGDNFNISFNHEWLKISEHNKNGLLGNIFHDLTSVKLTSLHFTLFATFSYFHQLSLQLLI